MKKIIAFLLALTIMCFSFAACNKPSDAQDDAANNTDPKDKVELSLENFNTYFEFVEEPIFTKNSSGETDALRLRHYYKLKSDYKIDLEKSSIEITYNHTYRSRPITVNFKDQTFKFGAQSGSKKLINDRVIDKLSMINYLQCAILLLQPDKVTKDTKETLYYDDFELTSVKGTLYFVNE